MADSEIIEKAYADAIANLFAHYFASLTSGQPEAECIAHFRNGVEVARKARAGALSAL